MKPYYKLRWRDDATGFVARFAGQWATSSPSGDLVGLEQIKRAMPNGDQIEIVEVPR